MAERDTVIMSKCVSALEATLQDNYTLEAMCYVVLKAVMDETGSIRTQEEIARILGIEDAPEEPAP